MLFLLTDKSFHKTNKAEVTKLERKIPKVIHYCWFGGKPLPPLAKKCIASWKKYCPDYRIVQWNEDSFDLERCDFIKEAYAEKRWAFVSDAARLFVIYEHGGVYLDTDVELKASLDALAGENEFFFGIEKQTNIRKQTEAARVNTGLGFGAAAGCEAVGAMLEEYTGIHFNSSGVDDVTPCPTKNSHALERYGFDYKDKLYRFGGGVIYPSEYMCPKEHMTGLTHFSDKTVSIHHYGESWVTPRVKYWNKLNLKFRQFLPDAVSHYLASYISYLVFYGLIMGHFKLFKTLFVKVRGRLI